MATALDPNMIQQLLSRTRSRGEYDEELSEFLSSGQVGVEIALTEGRFAGKGAKQVKTGFDNARKKTNANGLVHAGGQNVKVVAVTPKEGEEGEEHLYLINQALVGQENGSGDTTSA
jgi:hypothetical protein